MNGYQLLGGMVTLTLESTRVSYFEATPRPTRVIVGRLNLTAEGAVNLATQLYDFLLENGAIKPRSSVQ